MAPRGPLRDASRLSSECHPVNSGAARPRGRLSEIVGVTGVVSSVLNDIGLGTTGRYTGLLPRVAGTTGIGDWLNTSIQIDTGKRTTERVATLPHQRSAPPLLVPDLVVDRSGALALDADDQVSVINDVIIGVVEASRFKAVRVRRAEFGRRGEATG